jgi:hypothetical protein
MKHPINGSHIDLDEVSMVGPLKRGPEGAWIFGVMWKRTGTVGNVDATPPVGDQKKLFLLDGSDPDKPTAIVAYKKFLAAWYGRDVGEDFIPVSELSDGGAALVSATAPVISFDPLN